MKPKQRKHLSVLHALRASSMAVSPSAVQTSLSSLCLASIDSLRLDSTGKENRENRMQSHACMDYAEVHPVLQELKNRENHFLNTNPTNLTNNILSKTKTEKTRFCCLWVSPICFQFVQQWMKARLSSLQHEKKPPGGLNNRIEKPRSQLLSKTEDYKCFSR